jgi:hypothetical protein
MPPIASPPEGHALVVDRNEPNEFSKADLSMFAPS